MVRQPARSAFTRGRRSQGTPRFRRLYQLLRSGKLEVRVLPDQIFGLIHGKAGVITLADGQQTSFMGSANESRSAWHQADPHHLSQNVTLTVAARDA